MRSLFIWVLLAVATAVPAAAETLRGRLVCTAVPGSPPDRAVEMTVHTNGARLTYNHQILNYDGTGAALAETGRGTLSGEQVTLTGGASTRGVHEDASYAGTLRDGRLQLQGKQTWDLYMPGVHFTWPCTAMLSR